jgi:hypothetical protein
MGGHCDTRKGAYRSYHCNRRYRFPYQNPTGTSCKKWVSATVVETLVWEKLTAGTKDPAMFAKAINDLRQDAQQESTALAKERAVYAEHVAERQRKIKKAYEAYEGEAMGLAEYKETRARYEMEITSFTAQMARVDALLQDLAVEELDLRGVEEFRANVQGTWTSSRWRKNVAPSMPFG